MPISQAVSRISTIACLLGLILVPIDFMVYEGEEKHDGLLKNLAINFAGMAHAASSQEEAFPSHPPTQFAQIMPRPTERPNRIKIPKLPTPVPPGQVRKVTKAALLDQCQRLPKCKAQLQNAKRGVRPRSLFLPIQPGKILEEQELVPIPQGAPLAPRLQPRSEQVLPKERSTILSWLNPFNVSPVQAQSGFSLNLTLPDNWKSPDYYGGLMKLYGASYLGGFYLYDKSYISVNRLATENNPYVYLSTGALPSEGWYFINFQASQGKAKLRHHSRPRSIEAWNFTGNSCLVCDYLSLMYLGKGTHILYFWPDDSSFYIYGSSVHAF